MLVQKARAFAKCNLAELRPLFTNIDRQRERLGLEALSSGEQLYRVTPGDWERPLERYWTRRRRAGVSAVSGRGQGYGVLNF